MVRVHLLKNLKTFDKYEPYLCSGKMHFQMFLDEFQFQRKNYLLFWHMVVFVFQILFNSLPAPIILTLFVNLLNFGNVIFDWQPFNWKQLHEAPHSFIWQRNCERFVSHFVLTTTYCQVDLSATFTYYGTPPKVV